MSRTAVALLALAALISVVQWCWAKASSHVDLLLMPPHSRRHVQWLQSNSSHIQLGSALLAASAVCVQTAWMLG